MKIGSLVKKIKGRDSGKTGVVIEIANMGKDKYEILTVLSESRVVNWAAHLTEADHEDCDCGQH